MAAGEFADASTTVVQVKEQTSQLSVTKMPSPFVSHV
jgi:hypothetical protein